MTLHHSAKSADDLEDRRSIRFYFRGDQDLVPCLVSWDALDRLEGSKAASRADRLARFEHHRPRIEAAALKKFEAQHPAEGTLTLDADEVMKGPAL